MTAKDFYRILSQVKGMEWGFVCSQSMGLCVRGRRHWFYYNPLSAVASAVKRDFVDRSNKNINKILGLDRRTFRRINAACHEERGHSKVVRQKILKACQLTKPTTA